MNEAIESNYEEYRPRYRPISTESGVTSTDTEEQRESAYVSRKRILQNHRQASIYTVKSNGQDTPGLYPQRKQDDDRN